MKAVDFLDWDDATNRTASFDGEQTQRLSAAAFLDAAEPTAEELEQASRPARMTLTRGGQPVLEAPRRREGEQGPLPAHRDTELDRFYAETRLADRVLNPLTAGGKQVVQSAAAAGAAQAARELRELDAMRAGEFEGGLPRRVRSMSDEEFRAARQARVDALDREVGRIVGLQGEIERIPTNPAMKRAAQAKSVGEALAQFWRDPLGVTMGVGLQSLPASAPGLVAGTAGAMVGGPALGGALMGLGSFGAEYLNSVLDGLGDRGVDVKDPESLKAALQDPELMAEVRSDAATRGGIVGAFDALTFGVASKTLAPKALGRTARQVVNLPAQAGVQAIGGAAGEAGAQLATEGTITKPGQVVLEAVGAGFTAPMDVGGMALAQARRARPAVPGRPAPPTAADFLDQRIEPTLDVGPTREDLRAAAADWSRPAGSHAEDVTAEAVRSVASAPTVDEAIERAADATVRPDTGIQEAFLAGAGIAESAAREPGTQAIDPLAGVEDLTAEPPAARSPERWGAEVLERMERLERADAFLDGRSRTAEEMASPAVPHALPGALETARGALETPGLADEGSRARTREGQESTGPTLPDILGKPVERLTDATLRAVAKAGRTPELRSVAQAELDRRAGLRAPSVFRHTRDATAAQEAPEARTMEAPAQPPSAQPALPRLAAQPDSPQGLAEPDLLGRIEPSVSSEAPAPRILGKSPDQLTARELELVARAGTPTARAAAVAELERRGLPASTARPDDAIPPRAIEMRAQAVGGEEAADSVSTAVPSDLPSEEGGDAVSMMPGSNYAGFINDAAEPSSAPRSAGEPIRREEVLAPFLKAIGVPVYQGRVRGEGRQGYYKPGLEVVRIKRASDLETTAHEIAHLIDDRAFNGFGRRQGVPKARPWIVGPKARTYAAELAGVSYDRTKVYEGWAEYVRLYMTQPAKARAAAPEFSKWFDAFVQRHEYGPAILKARDDMRAWFEQDALARARSKIGDTRSINRHLDGFWGQFRQSTVDDLHGVYRMERELSGAITPRGAYETSRLTRGAHAMMDGAIKYGYLVRNADGSFAFRGKGLEPILKPVAKRLDDFLLYAVGRSARELKSQGRENLFTEGEIRAMVELETPEFRRAFAEYQLWNKGILDFAEGHGVINAKSRSLWRRAEYLPFHRVGSGEPGQRIGGAEGNWRGIQKLTGGTENIRDVLGNMIGNATMLIDVALKNDARAQIAKLAERTIGGGRFLERIPDDSRKVAVNKEQLRRRLLEAAGVSRTPGGDQAEIVKTIDDILEGAPALVDFFVGGQTPSGADIMAVLKDGKPTYYEVVDPILYRAVSALNRPAQSTLLKWLSMPKRIGQASITLTPDFAVANIARDTLMGAIMSRSGFRPAVDSIRGLTARLANDPAYAEYIANGGGYASYFVDEGAFRAHLARFYSERGINPRTVLDAPGKFLHFMEVLFDSFELSTRLGEFKRLRAQGMHPRQAAYLGREISTDFAMRGDSRTLGFFYDTVMFLRPAVVSMDRLFRGVAHDPNRGAIAAKSAAVALASAALYLVNRDNEEYQDLPDWDRDNYWHFFIPTPSGRDAHFRYPKIWEVGALATLAERTVERVMDREPKEYAKDFGRVLRQAFNLNFMPQALGPIHEQLTNRDSFTGIPIEPRGLEDLQPFLRSKPGTSETMRQLGLATRDFPEALQVNPARAEAMLTGYLNTWAMYGLMLSDAALFHDRLPERRLDQYPVIRRFFRQEPPLQTKHEKTFYEMLEETRRLRATMRELDKLGLPEGEEGDPDVDARHKRLSQAQRRLAAIRREADAVRRSDLSPAEKRKELDTLTVERNSLFKGAVLEERNGR